MAHEQEQCFFHAVVGGSPLDNELLSVLVGEVGPLSWDRWHLTRHEAYNFSDAAKPVMAAIPASTVVRSLYCAWDRATAKEMMATMTVAVRIRGSVLILKSSLYSISGREHDGA